jgi:hypothetical protein
MALCVTQRRVYHAVTQRAHCSYAHSTERALRIPSSSLKKEDAMFKPIRHIILGALLSVSAALTWAQAVTVVEYYNKPLDAYFITGRVAEQTALDAQASFERTGMTFQAVAASGAPASATRVCRFYISTATPFSSTHFYGREGVDCEQIRALNVAGFAWEDYDFALAQPVGGSCPAGSTTVYRGFRPAANGKTANHHYTTSFASYSAGINAGYVGELAAFCSTAATDVTQTVAADCGTWYYPVARINYQSTTSAGVADSWVRFRANSPVVFNDKQATPIVDLPPSGLTRLTLIEDATDTWTELGTRNQGNTGSLETYFTPATIYPRRMTVGQQVAINRTLTSDPVDPAGSGTQTGNITLAGREAVTVTAGTYNACKFTSETTTRYATSGRTEVARTTLWVAANVGIVKSTTLLRTTTGGASPVTTEITTDVTAVSAR